METKRMEHLYRLLKEAENRKDVDGAAALRWAIFTLEQRDQQDQQISRPPVPVVHVRAKM